MKLISLTLILLFSLTSYSQDYFNSSEEETEDSEISFDRPPVDDCQRPFSDCWCDEREGHPLCPDIDPDPETPINSLWWTVIGISFAVLLAFVWFNRERIINIIKNK